MNRITLIILGVLSLSTSVAAAEPGRETIEAWNAYVARTVDRPARPGSAPRGEMIDIPGGTIYHSSGSTLIRRTTVARPIVDRIARESLSRTLLSVQRFLEAV